MTSLFYSKGGYISFLKAEICPHNTVQIISEEKYKILKETVPQNELDS
jgi:hypothetical protein